MRQMPGDEKRRQRQFDKQKLREIEHLVKAIERLVARLAEHPEQRELLQAQIDQAQRALRQVERRRYPG